MLFNLELSLLEVLFVYTIKKAKSDIFSLAANIPSLQLVTGLLDSTKGAVKGHVLVKGPWVGLMVHREKEFAPNQSLKVPGEVNSTNPFLSLRNEFIIITDLLIYCLSLVFIGADRRGRLVE